MIELTLEQVRQMLDKTVFDRGMEYYREGRVQDVQHVTEQNTPAMHCRVRGNGTYRVLIREREKGHLLCSCSCYHFYFHNECKHLAAAMIHCAQHPQGRAVSDWNARALLKT